MAKIEYGQKVMVSKQYLYEYDQEQNKRWDTVELKKVDGIYLGKRVIKEGSTVYKSDHMPYFVPDAMITCAYVSVGPTQNPIYVPLDNVCVPDRECDICQLPLCDDCDSSLTLYHDQLNICDTKRGSETEPHQEP